MKLKILLILFFIAVLQVTQAQNIGLYEQFAGRYDFVFFGNTLNQGENGTGLPCAINTSSSAELNLSPDNQVQAAYLYWAGSGPGEFDITLNGQPITAERTFNLTYNSRIFFSAFSDITNIVLAQGNGTYTVSNFDLTDVINGITEENLYCSNATNFGGWAVVVVYKNDALPLNQLNLYDGLQNVPDQINISLPSLNVIDNNGAKIGFLAWEGDEFISVNETLRINGNILGNPPLNPVTNAFNGTNSFTGSATLYNMDLDVYDIQNFIQPGDSTAQIQLTSGQDFVMINAIMTKLNSQLPNASITVDNITKICNQNLLVLNYTVYNTNSTDVLPAGTPIAIYLDGVLFATAQTQNDIAIDGNEPGSITLTMPAGITGEAELLFVVDDNGTGTGTVLEVDETNNTFSFTETFWLLPEITAANITECETFNNSGVAVFDFSGYQESLKNNPTDVISFYNSLGGAQGGNMPITNPSSYQSSQNPEEIFIRLVDENGCVGTGSFLLIAEDCILPDATVIIDDVQQDCDSREITVAYTLGNINGQDILPAGTPVAVYANNVLLVIFNTTNDIAAGGTFSSTVTLTIPASISLNFNLIFVADDSGNGTGIEPESDENNNSFTRSVILWVSPVLSQPAGITGCETFNGSGIGLFDFSGYEDSLKNNPDDVITFYETQEAAIAGSADNIANPGAYEAADGTEIYVRITDGNGCFDTASFTLTIIDCYFPDATVTIEEIFKQCNSRILHIHYSVNNFDGTDVLPAGTPVSIYADGQLLTVTQTQQDIAIGETEEGYLTVTVPIGIPLTFNLVFVADDTGNGTGTVVEIDENNNTGAEATTLPLSPVLQQPDDITECYVAQDNTVFDFSGYAESLKNYDNETVTFYTTQPLADQDLDRIYNTSAYRPAETPQRIYVRLDNGTCFTTASFLLIAEKCPPVVYNYVTPNGDGYNDTFFIENLRDVFVNFKLSIYNRWGNLVWTGDNTKEDWDCIASVEKVGPEGTTVPTGTYYYVLELNDPDFPEPLVGWVYVTR